MADVNAFDPVDVLGLASASRGGRAAYSLDVVEAAVVPDSVAPVVSNVSPAPGLPIEANAAVSFDVTEVTFLAAIFVWVAYPATGATEVIFDGESFTARFGQLSTRVAIADGFSYTINRVGGWPSNPEIKVAAVDGAGNFSS